jgi:hypothetical protein
VTNEKGQGCPIFPYISVACVVGPNVNTFVIFHILRIKIFQIWQCQHIVTSIHFSFQTQFLQFT